MPTTPRLLVNPEISTIGDGIGIKSETSEGFPVYSTLKIIKDEYDGLIRKKIGLSVSSGCRVGCIYCFTLLIKNYLPLTQEMMLEQVEMVEGLPLFGHEASETKVSYKQMGDPLLNHNAVVETIKELYYKHPRYLHVVSTSSPKVGTGFYHQLALMAASGIPIRLQFSCHTTDDAERRRLSPRQEMSSLVEIARIVNNWPVGKVTLNFVMLDGCSYNAQTIIRQFDKEKTFIKVNWLDANKVTLVNGLRDLEADAVAQFAKRLSDAGFTVRARQHESAYLKPG